MTFTLTKPDAANYTPADLMREYAKSARLECVTGFWGNCYLVMNGAGYVYDHWSITARKDRPGWHEVKVYLTPRRLA